MTDMTQDNRDAGREIPGQQSAGAGQCYPPAGRWGRSAYPPEDSRQKSPVLAGVLSLMPGLGQVYVGYYPQGFIHILVVGSLIALLDRGVGRLEPLCGIFLAFFWLYNIVDAWRRATLYNLALAGLGPQELPEAVRVPETRGSLIGGGILIVFGAVLLAHTRFGMSLIWVETWWPMAFILVGTYLVYKAIKGRDKQGAKE